MDLRGIRRPITTAVVLLSLGGLAASAQTAPRPAGPVTGEPVRLWWTSMKVDSAWGTDSVVCGHFREIRGDTLIVARLDGSPRRRSCGSPSRRQGSAPTDVSYRLADIQSLAVHRPREARRIGWTDARQGMGEGAVIGLALGAIVGSIVGRFDEGRVLEDGLIGSGIGTVVGTVGGGLMSFQSGYDGGWVWVAIPRSPRR